MMQTHHKARTCYSFSFLQIIIVPEMKYDEKAVEIFLRKQQLKRKSERDNRVYGKHQDCNFSSSVAPSSAESL